MSFFGKCSRQDLLFCALVSCALAILSSLVENYRLKGIHPVPTAEMDRLTGGTYTTCIGRRTEFRCEGASMSDECPGLPGGGSYCDASWCAKDCKQAVMAFGGLTSVGKYKIATYNCAFKAQDKCVPGSYFGCNCDATLGGPKSCGTYQDWDGVTPAESCTGS